MRDLIPAIDDMPAEVLEAAVVKASLDLHADNCPDDIDEECLCQTWEREAELAIRAAYPAIAAWVAAQTLHRAASSIDLMRVAQSKALRTVDPDDFDTPLEFAEALARISLHDSANEIGGDHE